MKKEFYLKYAWIYKEIGLNLFLVLATFLLMWYTFYYKLPDPISNFELVFGLIFFLILLQCQVFLFFSFFRHREAFHLVKENIPVITISSTQIEYKLADLFHVVKFENIASFKTSNVYSYALLNIKFKCPMKVNRRSIPIWGKFKIHFRRYKNSCVWVLPELEGDVELLIDHLNARIQ